MLKILSPQARHQSLIVAYLDFALILDDLAMDVKVDNISSPEYEEQKYQAFV